jgi:hypothetical protein
MANMLPSEITALWRRLDLPDPCLSREIVDGMRAAKDPRKTLLDCPWNYPTDRYSRACHVAWCVSFRLTRKRGEVPFITLTERRVA